MDGGLDRPGLNRSVIVRQRSRLIGHKPLRTILSVVMTMIVDREIARECYASRRGEWGEENGQ